MLAAGAAGQPAELVADGMITRVERGELPQASLMEAFETAKQAREPVRLL